MITKKFGVDFNSPGGALTLSPSYVREDSPADREKIQTKTHDNGWTVSGRIWEDYYEWVNEFEAEHPQLGKVWGNFEGEVFADSEEAFEDFYKHFPPDDWDYGDIQTTAHADIKQNNFWCQPNPQRFVLAGFSLQCLTARICGNVDQDPHQVKSEASRCNQI